MWYDDKKKMCCFQSQNKLRVNIQVVLDYSVLKVCWIKNTASSLSYELGIHGEKKSMETEIILIKWT